MTAPKLTATDRADLASAIAGEAPEDDAHRDRLDALRERGLLGRVHSINYLTDLGREAVAEGDDVPADDSVNVETWIEYRIRNSERALWAGNGWLPRDKWTARPRNTQWGSVVKEPWSACSRALAMAALWELRHQGHDARLVRVRRTRTTRRSEAA